MTHDRDRTCGILLGLAVLVFVPQQSKGAELKRLPPVQSEEKAETSIRPLRPVKVKAIPGEISQSVWLQAVADSPGQVGTKATPRAVQLVNWNEEPFVPPVQIEMDAATESVTKPYTPQVPQPLMKLVSQQAGEPTLAMAPDEPKVPAAGQAAGQAAKPVAEDPVPPAPTVGQTAAPTAGQTAEPATGHAAEQGETVKPGTPIVDDSCEVFDDSDCYGDVLPPCWYFQAEALMLFRSDVRTIKIVEEGTGQPVRGQRDALLTTDALDPNPAWGPRFTLGHYLNDVRNLELVYFGLHRWRSQAAFDGINGVGFSFNNIDVPFDANITSDFDGAQFISGTYASNINNFEANLVTNNRWDLNVTTGYPWYHYVDFLAGFRYFRLSEEFDLRSTDAGETSDYLIDTVNDLVGGQLGVIVGTYNSPRVSWNMSAKAGLFTNFARQSTLMRDDDNTVLFRDFVNESKQLAFVGDWNFNLVYDVRPNMSVTAGYYLLYVGGVALAPEQLDFTTTPTSGSGINANGGAFYHGPSVGLRFNY